MRPALSNALRVIALFGAAVAGACAPSDRPHAVDAQAAPATPVRSEPDSIVRAGATLRGTLELPASSCGSPVPVALIIAGSGPTDRDGNSAMIRGDNNSLRLLAESLAAECIASLRYDKRGIGASTAPGLREEDLRFTTYADDAAAWIRHLHQDPRFARVVVMGHSEGAMLGTLAARDAAVDALVLIAGAGRPIGVTLRDQLREGLSEDMYRQADSILVELEAGRTVANVPARMFAYFRPSVQPYLMSWLPLDPAAELARLDVPALVVWGTSDLQALRADADRLAAADSDVRFVVVEGMNHVLKPVGGTLQEQRPSYGDPTIPLSPGLVPAIVDFLRAVAPSRQTVPSP